MYKIREFNKTNGYKALLHYSNCMSTKHRPLEDYKNDNTDTVNY